MPYPPTPSITASNTPTPSITASQTPTYSPTGTACPGITPTQTPSNTATPVVTASLTTRATPTPTSTPTNTPTHTQTPTPTKTVYNLYEADRYICDGPGCALDTTGIIVALPSTVSPNYGKYYPSLVPDGFVYLLQTTATGGPGWILNTINFTSCNSACAYIP